MGLAPYGNPDAKIPKSRKTYIEVFREIISYKKGLDYKINVGVENPHLANIFGCYYYGAI